MPGLIRTRTAALLAVVGAGVIGLLAQGQTLAGEWRPIPDRVVPTGARPGPPLRITQNSDHLSILAGEARRDYRLDGRSVTSAHGSVTATWRSETLTVVETTDRSRDITTYQLDADGNLVVIETINVKYVKQGLPWSDTIGPVTRVYKRNNF